LLKASRLAHVSSNGNVNVPRNKVKTDAQPKPVHRMNVWKWTPYMSVKSGTGSQMWLPIREVRKPRKLVIKTRLTKGVVNCWVKLLVDWVTNNISVQLHNQRSAHKCITADHDEQELFEKSRILNQGQ